MTQELQCKHVILSTNNDKYAKPKVENYGFNWRFVQHFWRLLQMIFPGWRSVTISLFVLLLLLLVAEQVLIFYVGQVPSWFYGVLAEKDELAFKSITVKAVFLILGISFIKATVLYVTSVFYVASRNHVSLSLHSIYFSGIRYYQINLLDFEIDNPDQRITQDVDKTCRVLSQVSAKLLIAPFTISYYIYQTWKQTGVLGPICVCVFFILSSIINKFMMSPVASLVYKQEKLEGDFRYKHMFIRSNAESAAFLRCGEVEIIKTNKKLKKLISTQHLRVLKEYLLNFVVSLAEYIGSILSYVILAIAIFTGRYDDLSSSQLASLISKNAFITIYLIYSFTQLLALATMVSEMAGTTHRIGQLVDHLSALPGLPEETCPDKDGDCGVEENGCCSKRISTTSITCKSNSDTSCSTATTSLSNGWVVPHALKSGDTLNEIKPVYTLHSVSYAAPSADLLLVKNLTIQLICGVNVLVNGPSGCGKTSLLRILDGLWEPISGCVKRNDEKTFFLPQKPLLTEGTLRQQIIYPSLEPKCHGMGDEELIQHLKDANLMTVFDRVGGLDVAVDWDWTEVLSPGEMQRLSFIRLYYNHPSYAVLDEATSQVSTDMERRLYEECSRKHITLLSVGHRESLRTYHDMLLHLDGTGGWTFTNIPNDDLV